MFLENLKESYLSVNIAGKDVSFAPNGSVGSVVSVKDEYADDDTLRTLIEREWVKVQGKEEGTKAVAEQQEAIEEESKSKTKLVAQADTTEHKTINVQCAAVTGKGDRCSHHVSVPVDEYDKDAPYFCGRHKNENPDDYERVDGDWKRKVGTAE
jgi:hypothetical protein